MATKTQMIEEILELTDKYTEEELEEKLYIEISNILKEEQENIELIDDDNDKLTDKEKEFAHELNKLHGVDGEEEIKKLKANAKKMMEEEKEEIDISKLSMAKQRAYARTGIIPKIKVNRYSRFNDEDVKLGF